MKLFKIPSWLPFFYRRRIWKLPVATGQKQLFLTFDDGPTEALTEWILHQLKTHNAKATFFCVGANAEKLPQKIQNIKADGHVVGNHTYSHLQGWRTPLAAYVADVKNASRIIESKLFRPPYGKITRRQQQALLKSGYKIIMWHVLTYDFDKQLNVEAAWRKIERSIENGSVIVLHDNEKARHNLQFLLPRILKTFSQKGFSFEPICL